MRDVAADAVDITTTCAYWGGYCDPPYVGGCDQPQAPLPTLPGTAGCPPPCPPGDPPCQKAIMCCAPPTGKCSDSVYCYQGWECRGGPDPSKWCIPTPHDPGASYNCGKINCTNGCTCAYPWESICDCTGMLSDAGSDAGGDAGSEAGPADAGDQ